jgi:methane/ammonia monooxygenase subunit A
MILFVVFFIVLGGYHIHFMLTGGDWDFWTDWKDRRLWVVVPIVAVTFPAAVQAFAWDVIVCLGARLFAFWVVVW